MAFLRRYHEHLAQFKRDLLAWQEQLPTPAGVCLEGCRGCLPGFAGEQ
jgi:hypothetical protein